MEREVADDFVKSIRKQNFQRFTNCAVRRAPLGLQLAVVRDFLNERVTEDVHRVI